MDLNRIFAGVPDGQGFREDPANLVPVYSEFEAACFGSASPFRVDLSRGWFPVGKYLAEFPLRRKSRWMMFQTVFEGIRFAETAIATMQLLDDTARSTLNSERSLPSSYACLLAIVVYEDSPGISGGVFRSVCPPRGAKILGCSDVIYS